MSPRDRRNSADHNQNPEGGNENKQRRTPMVMISLISGIIIATALGASVITAVILKNNSTVGENNSTTLPTPTIVESPSASPTPSVAESPTISPTPSVAESPSASPTPSVAESPTISPTPSVAESPTISPTPSVAESPSASPTATAVSLLDTDCLSSTPGVEQSLVKQHKPQNIAIGGEVLPEIAYLFSQSDTPYSYIPNSKPAGVSCALNSKFRQLNLVVGINGKHPNAPHGDQIVFEVSVDNKVVATKDLTVNAKQVLKINVQNARSVGLKATCTSNSYNCPDVSFVEMSLN